MYLKWFDKNYKYQIISEHKGEEAGIKSSTLKVKWRISLWVDETESGSSADLFVFLHLIAALEDIQVLQVFGCIQKLMKR